NSPLRPNDNPPKGRPPNPYETNPGKNHTCQRNPNQSTNPKASRSDKDQKALAFSTLLSSQETDTHRQDPVSSSRLGHFLYLTDPFPFVESTDSGNISARPVFSD
ncbi:hypothetical protein NE236_29915, partial [Actinoallomurus purpureus]|uniref:hypothetical protein n=1 Tax=Actinoallomurus purpureus TaxID=478114 RepID=UPI002093E043